MEILPIVTAQECRIETGRELFCRNAANELVADLRLAIRTRSLGQAGA